MSDNLKKYSFKDILKQGQLRIPKIQRDYAQGRLNPKVTEIRKGFVHTLLLVIKGKHPMVELDFVYGSNSDGAFEPLDGQQRLTTLFLLHWMMGIDLSKVEDKKHSIFTYETRNTSEAFCDEIVQHDAIRIVEEARWKSKRVDNRIAPSNIIKGRDWFRWEWRFDSTVLSMLVMIDDIYQEMGNDWSLDLSKHRERLDNITFNLLNLGEFDLSNELFIKMNARGKQLSDFDMLKSALEEELQLQQKEYFENGSVLATEADECDWRRLMDGPWVDLFWHKYARKEIEETELIESEERDAKRLHVAKLSELQFKKLLLRLIALQLFEQNPALEELQEATYQIDETKIDRVMTAYRDSLINLRNYEENSEIPQTQVILNFPKLIKDFNSLIYQDNNGIYYEISYLFTKVSHMENDDRSLFDSFLETKVANDVELTFYSMLLFLRKFPTQKNDWLFDKDRHKLWLKNLEEWVRAMRNILLNDNNNQRIDKRNYTQEAMQSLKKMMDELEVFVRDNTLNVETDGIVIRKFLKSLQEKTYSRIDNQSLAEEVLKAQLKLEDIRWEFYIDEVEKHKYLWGQIRCLLSWANKDIEQFKDYSTRLIDLLDFIESNSLKYYAGILAVDSYYWRENNRLYQYNKDRDNSFKRYLRNFSIDDYTYGMRIKNLLDIWKKNYMEAKVEDFLDGIITSALTMSDQWVRCILLKPLILEEAWNKRLFEADGHVIIAQRKTRDSHCFDPLFIYLRIICEEHHFDEKNYKLYDSKGDYSHAFELRYDDSKILVQWHTDGNYKVEDNDMMIQIFTPKEMINYMEQTINKYVLDKGVTIDVSSI